MFNDYTKGRMRIIQLSDIHYPSAWDHTGEVDVVANFNKIVRHLENEQFDAIVLTGDLCYMNADKTVYKYLHERLSCFKCPVLPIAGNHDSAVEIAPVFNIQNELKGRRLYYHREFRGVTAVFLDSSEGVLQKEQMRFLERVAESSHSKKLVLFIHHPPVYADVKYMQQKYSLSNIAEVSEWMASLPFMLYVFCGHYHSERTVLGKNANVFLCPSLLYQVDPVADFLRHAEYRPAFRSIEFNGTGVQTNVVYVD